MSKVSNFIQAVKEGKSAMVETAFKSAIATVVDQKLSELKKEVAAKMCEQKK